MVERIQRKPLVLVAMLLTVGNLLVVWAFRFLPLYDYPIWLYEVRIMRALSGPMFSNTYEIAAAPVPNLGFVGPVSMLSFLFPLEVCGKIVLSLCVAAFPWTVRHCVRAMSGGFILMFSRGRVSQRWAAVFVFAAFCVMLYNAVHFKKVDEQMQALYRDLVSHVELRGKSFRSVRFDYPPPRDAWDIAAASIDPLFGAVYYAGLESGGGEAWIFGSALLKKRGGKHHLEAQENSKDELARRLLADPGNLPSDVVVLLGNHPAIEQHLKQYRGPYHLGKNWTILMRSVQ